MNIVFAKKAQFTQAEREALHWLGERAKYLDVKVTRRSPKEFDLGIEGTYDSDDGYDYGIEDSEQAKRATQPDGTTSEPIRMYRRRRGFAQVSPANFSAWFPLAALREFWSMRLHSPMHGDWSFTRDWPAETIWAEFDRIVAYASAALAHPRLKFSDNLLRAVRGTWQALAEESLVVENNAEAIELVLDADRIAMYGDRAAYEELNRLDSQFGYEQVSKALAKQVKLV